MLTGIHEFEDELIRERLAVAEIAQGLLAVGTHFSGLGQPQGRKWGCHAGPSG
jgi:hypothetical protein